MAQQDGSTTVTQLCVSLPQLHLTHDDVLNNTQLICS